MLSDIVLWWLCNEAQAPGWCYLLIAIHIIYRTFFQ